MRFSTIVAALSAASVVSARLNQRGAHRRRTGVAKPPSITSQGWNDIYEKCGNTKQVGNVNVDVDACLVAELFNLSGDSSSVVTDLLDSKVKRTGVAKPPTITSDSWNKIWEDCESTKQVGNVNVAVPVCAVAQAGNILGSSSSIVTDLLDSKVKRTGVAKPPSITSQGWNDIYEKCGNTKQVGNVNVDVDACLVAELLNLSGDSSSVVTDLLDSKVKRTGVAKPPTITSGSWNKIWEDCGSTKQVGNVNVAVPVCAVAEALNILGSSSSIDTNGGDSKKVKRTGVAKPPSITSQGWNDIYEKCGNTKQVGNVNVDVDACLVAELLNLSGDSSSVVTDLLDSKVKRTGVAKPPTITSGSWNKIWEDCKSTKQVGNVNVAVPVCAVAQALNILGSSSSIVTDALDS